MNYITPYKRLQGSIKLKYVISTPNSTLAESIDKKLPTVLFIHPVYIASDIWHPQFTDPQLRRFNLIALDLRAHGETGGQVTEGYGPMVAAEDVVKLMDAIQVKSCYLAGLSMGTIIATQVAISYPNRVLGLFLISPLGMEEPESVATGREEICDVWEDGISNNDQSLLDTAVSGALQLGFTNVNDIETSLALALVKRTFPQALKHWGKKSLFDSYRIATVDFFVKRKSFEIQDLSKIKGPVVLVHCLEDVAYDLAYTESFLQRLKEAGVDVTLHTIEAPHFGSVTHPHLINPLLHELVAQHTESKIPLAVDKVVSPFEANLVQAGYRQDEPDEDLFNVYGSTSVVV